MQNILLFLVLILFPGVNYGNEHDLVFDDNRLHLTVPHNEICSINSLYLNNGIEILEIETSDGKIIYNVIATIATIFLPEVVKGICNVTLRNPKACAIAYDATSALVSLRGERIFKGISKGVRWIANRGRQRSKVTIETRIYNLGSSVKDALDFYRRKGCVKWNKVSINKNKSNVTNFSIKRDNMPTAIKDVSSCHHNGKHRLKLINMTKATLRLKIRNGRGSWSSKTLNSGHSLTFSSFKSKYWEVKMNIRNGNSFYKKFKCDPDDARCFQWNNHLKNFVGLICEWNQ